MQYFIIDFDGTFTRVEALDELAKISLRDDPDKKSKLKEIETLTKQGMNGDIPFNESLNKRLRLLGANKKHISELVKSLRRMITLSFERNKEFFRKNRECVFIFSGGFKSFILPIIRKFSIPAKNVYANTFVFDKSDNIVGYDEENPMSHENGKIEQLKKLELKGDIFVVGDGYTDFQMKESGLIKQFIAFTENIERNTVTSQADAIAPSFDEFLFVNHLPMSISYPKNRITILTDNKDDKALYEKDGFSVGSCSESFRNASVISAERLKLKAPDLAKTRRLMALQADDSSDIDLDACTIKGVPVFKNAQQVIKYINTGNTKGSVNFPNLSLPKEEHIRLLHVHRNVPGMLANINSVIAHHNINIEGQYLKTNNLIGYALIDVGTGYGKKTFDFLKKIPNTVKFRIIK